MEWLMGKGKKTKIINTEEVKENKPYLEESYLNNSVMDKAVIKEIISLPPGIDYNEWIATHTLGHFNTLNLLYGCISEVCTTTTCPVMSAPGALTYLWYDEKGKKTKTLIPAPQYIDYVMTYVEKHVHDNSIFPSKFGMTFPSHFVATVKKIEKLLFHVLVHLFFTHYLDFVNMGLHTHLNCAFMNFVIFNQEFNTLDPKEMAPLEDLAQLMGLMPPPPIPVQ
ncbi:MOB kinase activator 2-like isoform X2 [Actinia tenebrosa]|uniref:MOB kinase activator 2-like isoform X2 n=1 Tax=Actinia tenebrosa TaxID=6105 RepID=A0A6P8IZB7_ACTTE|nr:MOB kinase activator 2-like isoform X2 [Actinia tenebrosa]